MILKGEIVRRLDDCRVIVNLGYAAGVKKDMEFVVYEEKEEVFDPSGESLGRLEFVKARIKPVHIQENMSVMECSPNGLRSKLKGKSNQWNLSGLVIWLERMFEG